MRRFTGKPEIQFVRDIARWASFNRVPNVMTVCAPDVRRKPSPIHRPM